MNSRLALRAVLLLVICVTTVLIAVQPPAWIVLPLGSLVLAALYIVVRINSRYEPLDPRFGSCIPPISTKPRNRS